MSAPEEAAAAAGPTEPGAAPSDNTTMSAVLADLDGDGWTGQLVALEGGDVRCRSCGEASPAADLEVAVERRLEGASDPDDMALVVAAPCPACAVRSTIVLGFGPNASGADADVVAALPRTSPA